jgi:acyl-CoA thioesterase I
MIRKLQITLIATLFDAFIITLTAATFVATTSVSLVLADPVEPAAAAITCSAPGDLGRLNFALGRTTQRLAAGLPITIVAIGSSSTAGAGASSPYHSYPSRLAVELQQLFPGHSITVLNRGVNGEEAPEMLSRLSHAVLEEKPDLVLWQVGTNAVLHDMDLQPTGVSIHEGLLRLKASGADVVLIDPQFAPGVIAKAKIEGMISRIAALAKQDNVNLFRRFAIMQNWRKVSAIPFETFISPDDVHMNDWGYSCIAKILAGAIADAASRPIVTAGTIAR